jgi:hypothetical protein
MAGEPAALISGSPQAWIDGHTDQPIVLGSLLVGLWLIANGLSLIA